MRIVVGVGVGIALVGGSRLLFAIHTGLGGVLPGLAACARSGSVLVAPWRLCPALVHRVGVMIRASLVPASCTPPCPLVFAQAEHKKTAQDLGWQY